MKFLSMVKSKKGAATLLLFFLCCLIAIDGSAAREGQILLNGKVKSIDLASNTVVVTDYRGKDVVFSIKDNEILDKFRDGRIKVGDDVNIKYIIKDGKNVPFSFRKTAGC